MPTPNSYLVEDLCFDAQQAAEKAIKAVLLSRTIRFPYIHDLDELIELARAGGIEMTSVVEQAGLLSQYAVAARYPGIALEVTDEQHKQALSIAEAVFHWAERIVAQGTA